MQVNAVQITPVLREMAWKLHRPAQALGSIVSNEGYKFLVSMAIQNSAERELNSQNIPFECDWLNSPCPIPDEGYSAPFPDSEIERTKNELHRQLVSTLAKYDKQLMIPHRDFFTQYAPFRDLVTTLVMIYNNDPKVLESVGLYKEEALALSDIFKTISDDAFRMDDRIVIQMGGNQVVVMRKPVTIKIFNKLASLFRNLSKKLPTIPGKDSNTSDVNGLLSSFVCDPRGVMEIKEP